MTLGFVARAMRKGLAKTGEPSLLRGVDCGLVLLQRNVQIDPGIRDMAADNYVARYDMAMIDGAHNPVEGDVLEHPDGRFRLDRLHYDNGVTQQFIVVKAPL